MKLRPSLALVLSLVASLAFGGTAFADAPSKEAKKEAKEGKEGKKDDKDAKPGKKELTPEQKEERKKKRLEHLAEARAKWGEMLKKPGVKEEMKLHARRMARLRKMAKVAAAAKKPAIEKRANTLMDKEKARHDKRMDELKGQAAPAGTSTAAPAASATGGAK